MKRKHTSKGRPVVYVSTFTRITDAHTRTPKQGRRFALTYAARNGRIVRHPASYANSQAARRAAKAHYPGVRIERVS